MDNSAVKESLISFQSSQGYEGRGTPLKINRFATVFELCSPATFLRTSEVLPDFQIVLRDRAIYAGKAVVKTLINTGPLTICEASLGDGWIDVDLSATGEPGKLAAEFSNFVGEWEKLYRIRPEFKLLISDMQSFLTDMRLWLEQVELGIRSSPSADRLHLEHEISSQLSPAVVDAMDSIWDRFDPIATAIEEDARGAHQAFLRRHLHPLMLCSPFAYRTYHKPLGYAGDYESVNMILRDPYEGSSLFARMINSWLLQQSPARAHRNRIRYLKEKLLAETVRVAAKGRNARVLNIGCGPAAEVQRFLAEQEISNRAEFALLDFNDETLQHAGSVLGQLKSRHQRTTAIEPLRKSIHQILKEAGKHVQRPATLQYDFVYCAGLFDYLADVACQKLASIFYEWIAPGGLLLITNVDASKPFHRSMEYILEWHLNCRSGDQLVRLINPHSSLGTLAITSDETGVNLFAEIRKPIHG